MQPNIRTVAKQLLNPTEQVLLRTTVSLMTAYRFSFNMGKYGEEGEPEELLQPPIHTLCSFQVSLGASNCRSLAHAIANHVTETL